MISRKFLQGMRYFRSFIALRHTDIILAGYPKSGSTWLRFLLCNIGSLLEWGGRKINFEILDKTMIGLSGNLLKPWSFTVIPRVIVTHLRYLHIFNKCPSILLIRDPRDATVVRFYYCKNLIKAPYKRSFPKFIRHPRYGLEAWFKHFLSWRKHANLIICYEAMRQNTYKEFKKILKFCKVNCPDKIILSAIERSGLSSIRKIEETKGMPGFKPSFRFTNYGDVGLWHEWFSDADLEYLNFLQKKYNINLYMSEDAALYFPSEKNPSFGL